MATKRITPQKVFRIALDARIKHDGYDAGFRYHRLSDGQKAGWTAVADHINSFIAAKDNSDRVAMDALKKRDQAEADRDTARMEKHTLLNAR